MTRPWARVVAGRLDRQAQDDVRGLLDRDIVAIDAMLSEQLDAILHHDRLRRLDGNLRGLAWLVGGVESGARLKTKILNIGWGEICRDLERAVDSDQSNLFRKIYEDCSSACQAASRMAC